MAETQGTTQTAPSDQAERLPKRVEQALKQFEEMTALELAAFTKAFRKKFDISPAPMMMAGAIAAGPAGGAAAAEEEKATVDVILAAVGANKIQVIKEIRGMTSLGLKEAKDLVESAPKPVKQGVERAEAAELKKKLEAAGAKVELK